MAEAVWRCGRGAVVCRDRRGRAFGTSPRRCFRAFLSMGVCLLFCKYISDVDEFIAVILETEEERLERLVTQCKERSCVSITYLVSQSIYS